MHIIKLKPNPTSCQGELSLDLMQRLSASHLEELLNDCRIDSAVHRHMYVEAVSDDESIAVNLSSESPREAFPTISTSGGAELARLVRAQLELQEPVGSSNPPQMPPPSPIDDNEDGDEGD